MYVFPWLEWIDPETLDLFDRAQLESVVAVCRRSRSLPDADRLRKYLGRYGLDWDSVARGAGGS